MISDSCVSIDRSVTASKICKTMTATLDNPQPLNPLPPFLQLVSIRCSAPLCSYLTHLVFRNGDRIVDGNILTVISRDRPSPFFPSYASLMRRCALSPLGGMQL